MKLGFELVSAISNTSESQVWGRPWSCFVAVDMEPAFLLNGTLIESWPVQFGRFDAF